MKTHLKERSIASIALLSFGLGFLQPTTSRALDPATFEEYVGIGGKSSVGSNASIPEFVDVTLLLSEFENRGSGNGFARAGGVLPVTAEGVLHMTGGPSISGIGGTATVLTRYQFAIMPLAGGLPAVVPLIFHAFGSVSVDSNQPVGHSFARITTPFGQFQADNYDAQGAYVGIFSEQWDIPVANWNVGAAGTISLYATTHGQGFGPDYFFDSRTFIDPVIEVDPAFALADQYEVVYSSGISQIPEPSSVMLFDAGLVSLVACGRGRRREA
jgi:hypothetical protein